MHASYGETADTVKTQRQTLTVARVRAGIASPDGDGEGDQDANEHAAVGSRYNCAYASTLQRNDVPYPVLAA